MKLVYNYKDFYSELKKGKKLRLLPATLHDLFWIYFPDSSYSHLSHIVPDGMPIVHFLRGMRKNAERMYGPDLFREVLKKNPKSRHVFLGSKDNLVLLKQKLDLSDSLYVPLGFSQHGQNLFTKSVHKKLTGFDPDFIWLGIGSPKQVQLMAKLNKKFPNAHIFCVGAAFQFMVLRHLEAPEWIKKMSLEWLFRLLKEPKRLWKRYLYYSMIGLLHLPKLNQINMSNKQQFQKI